MNMNITVSDLNLYMSIGDAEILSADIVKDEIGMADRDYPRVIQHILNYAIANFNLVNALTPKDLRSISTNWVPLIREVVTLNASPYVQKEFLFIGFDTKTKFVKPVVLSNEAEAKLFLSE